MFCRYDEFSVDNAHNQALKAVLTRLLEFAMAPKAKQVVNSLLLRMTDISTQPPSAALLEKLRFDRITEVWLPSLQSCRAVPERPVPGRPSRASRQCLFAFRYGAFVEAYVGLLIRRAWRATGSEVRLQGPRRFFGRVANGEVFEMRPDAVVLRDGQCLRIYDTKWKMLDTSKRDLDVTPIRHVSDG